MGEQLEEFFQSSIFTYSHDNSIVAVAKGLLDAAAVDSLVWERFNRTSPEVTERACVIGRSEPYGIPPVVSSSTLPRSERDAVQQELLAVHEDSAGLGRRWLGSTRSFGPGFPAAKTRMGNGVAGVGSI